MLPRDPSVHVHDGQAACGNCGDVVPYRADEDPTERAPCPGCGSQDRGLNVEIEDAVSVDSYVDFGPERSPYRALVEPLKKRTTEPVRLSGGRIIARVITTTHRGADLKDLMRRA